MSKRKYYWLKLKEDFFRQKEMKRLRKVSGGDTFTIIYLKLLLLGIKTDGRIYFSGLEETFAEELALELDEKDDDVKVTLSFLATYGLVEYVSDRELIVSETKNLTGSEGASAERVRRHRERQKMLQSNNAMLQSNDNLLQSNVEIEREIEIDTDIEIEVENTESHLRGTSVQLTQNLITQIISKWNEVGLQEVRSINPGTNRHTMVKARLKEFGLEQILEAFENVKESAFLRGENNRGWTATLDWVIKPSNFSKVLEKNYNDKPEPIQQSPDGAERVAGSRGASKAAGTNQGKNSYSDGYSRNVQRTYNNFGEYRHNLTDEEIVKMWK